MLVRVDNVVEVVVHGEYYGASEDFIEGVEHGDGPVIVELVLSFTVLLIK